LRDDEDVGEDDRSIDKASISIDRLKRKVGSNLGAAAAFEEVVLALFFVVLGQVASSCSIVSTVFAPRYQ
jgi:hypothetical protein